MTDERRYSEDEIAEIFDRASETHAKGSPGGTSLSTTGDQGMSLVDLEEIGDEVGIPRALVRRAAADLDRPQVADVTADRRFLGATIGVGKVVHLPRDLTDHEWATLVVDLRDTFNAKGAIRQDGPFRQWTQGNLQALVEPTENGARLRLRTMKGSAVPAMIMGGTIAVTAGLSIISAANAPGMLSVWGVGVAGLVLHLSTRFQLPHWRRTRAEQMEQVIARLSAKIEASPAAEE